MAFFSQWLDMLRNEGISCSIDYFIAARRQYFEMWADFGISRIDLSERVQWREVAIGIDSNHFLSSVSRNLGSAGFSHDELVEQLDELRGSLAPLDRRDRLHSSRARINEIAHVLPTDPTSLSRHHFLAALR